MNNRNILVTGGSGFIGSYLIKELSKDNRVVTIIRDVIPTKWINEALSKVIIIKGDILDYGLLYRVINDYQIEEIYHLAAQAIVSVAINDPITTFKVNVMGTINILEACRQIDKNIRILVQSTDKVYGGDKMYVNEKDQLSSTIGVYETSKVCEDIIARLYGDYYSLNIRITRPCNVYGYDLAPRIIPNTIKDCLSGKTPIIYEGQENTIRNYIYIEDVIDALKCIMEHKGIFNVGTDDVLTQKEVVRIIAKFFNMEPIKIKRDKPIKEIHQQSVNWNKLKSIGWYPKYNFVKGIEKTIDTYKKYGWI